MKLINNQVIRDQRFSKSFGKIGSATNLTGAQKLALVKLRRQISDHCRDLMDTLDGMDNAQAIELMKEEVEFEWEPIDVQLVIDILSADDILVLSGTILTEV